jgi:hypothetical protein
VLSFVPGEIAIRDLSLLLSGAERTGSDLAGGYFIDFGRIQVRHPKEIWKGIGRRRWSIIG